MIEIFRRTDSDGDKFVMSGFEFGEWRYRALVAINNDETAGLTQEDVDKLADALDAYRSPTRTAPSVDLQKALDAANARIDVLTNELRRETDAHEDVKNELRYERNEYDRLRPFAHADMTRELAERVLAMLDAREDVAVWPVPQ